MLERTASLMRLMFIIRTCPIRNSYCKKKKEIDIRLGCYYYFYKLTFDQCLSFPFYLLCLWYLEYSMKQNEGKKKVTLSTDFVYLLYWDDIVMSLRHMNITLPNKSILIGPCIDIVSVLIARLNKKLNKKTITAI